MKRLLVTGHRGLLGSACVREFGSDHEVNTTPANLLNWSEVDSFIGACKPDVIIHCAAKVGGVKANRDNPVAFLLENLTIQNNVMRAAHAHGVSQLCFIATSCMFPLEATLPVQETSLLTGRLEGSVEAYAIAKIAGWRLCKAYCEEFGDQFITVAPSNVYGPQDRYDDQAHVIPSLIRKMHNAALTGQSMEVWGDGAAVREFIFSEDVASAIRVLLEHWKSPEVINVGTGIGTTIRDLVAAIGVTSPFNELPPVVWNAAAPVGIPRKTYSIEKLTSLGWKPKFSLHEGLHRTWFDFLNTKPRGL